MSIILNTNELGYLPFIDTPVDNFIIGLKSFSVNHKYCLSVKELTNVINILKNKNKTISLSVNIFASENEMKKFKKIFNKLKDLEIESYIVSDLGILNIFKENNLEHKVVLDLQTYVTNKYSAKSLLNLGVKRICVSKEITLEDIKDISVYNEGKIEILAQGYYPITYSKRPILSCYYKNFNQEKKSNHHYIKEENRKNYYTLLETSNNLSVYNDKQYSVFPYLDELLKSGIKNFRLDTNFLNEIEIKEYITYYDKAINLILNNKLNEYNSLKEEFVNKYVFDTPFMHNSSFLLKEGN